MRHLNITVLCLLVLGACSGGAGGGGGSANTNADPGGIYSGTLTNAAAATTDPLSGIVDESGNAVFIDETAPAIYRATVRPNGSQFDTSFRVYAGPGVNLPGGTTAVGTFSGTVTARGGITGSGTIGGSPAGQFDLSYEAGAYQTPASWDALAGVYEFAPSTSAAVDTVDVFISTSGAISGIDSYGCKISGTGSIPDSRYNAYDLAARIDCGGVVTQATGLASYTPAAGNVPASAVLEYDDGQSFAASGQPAKAVAATGNCPNISPARVVFGQASFGNATANSGGISASSLAGPLALAAGPGNALYIADTLNNRVLGYPAFSPARCFAGAAQFMLGQGGFSANSPGLGAGNGTAVGFALPGKVSVADSGQLVVTDTGNNRVLIWNVAPTSSTVAPDVVIGQASLTMGAANQGNDTPSAATLSHPVAAMIAGGKLVVVDNVNNRVLIWNTVPNVNNQPADLELGQSAVTNQGGFSVECTSNTGSAGFCFTTSASGTDAFVVTGTGNEYVLGINQPSDVWTDGHRLIVSDTMNNRVLYWASFPTAQNQMPSYVFGQQHFVQNLAGAGSQGLNVPSGLSSDSASLYVADTNNNRVLKFSLANVTSSGPAAMAVFGQEDFVHVTASDPDQDGTVGDQRNNPPSSGVTSATLHSPSGVLAAPGGQLYVTDSGDNRVLLFVSSAGVDGTSTNLCH